MSQPLEYTLKLANSAFTGPLNQARAGLGNFQRAAGGASASVGGLQSRFGSMAGMATGLAASIGGLAAVWQGLKSAVGGAANMESTGVAFKTLIGDANLAKRTLADLKKMGAETPFEFPELADAGRKLIAFGESAASVTDTLRRVGDVASGIQAPIGDIAELYGKARVQGRLFQEDINQLTGRGIPIIGELAKILKVGESEIRALTEAGQIGFPLIEQAFKNMTGAGGKFHNMMAEQSQTTKGLLSTLKDSIGQIFTTLGAPINDMLRPLMKEVISLTDSLGKKLETAVAVGRNAIAQGKMGEMLGLALEVGLRSFANAAVAWFKFVGAVLKAEFSFVFGNVKSLFTGAFNEPLKNLGTGMLQIFGGGAQYLLGALTETVTTFGGALVRTISGAATGAWQALKDAFTSAAAWLGNRLQLAWNTLLQSMQNIPGLGKLIEGDFSGAVTQLESAAMKLKAFTEDSITNSAFAVLNATTKALDSKKNKTEGAAAMQSGADLIEQGMTRGGKVVAANFAEAFADLKLPEIKDVAGAEEAMKKLETFVEKMKPKPLDDVNKAASGAATSVNAMAKAADKAAGKGESEGRKRIQGFSAARQGARGFGLEEQRRRSGTGFFGGREGAQKTATFFKEAGARRAQEMVGRREAARLDAEARAKGPAQRWDAVLSINQTLKSLAVA